MNKTIAMCAAAFFSLCACGSAFSEDSQIEAANRRTAVRHLKQAEQQLASERWEEALSSAEQGLAYDDSVADLWYTKAAAKDGLGAPRAEMLPLVMKAVTGGTWVDYNRDGARILYADLLCDTGSCVQALAVLDAPPVLHTADAEFIRAKAYYRLGTEDDIARARNKIDAARKVYSEDARFPLLFFQYEYALRRMDRQEDAASAALVQKIAESFIIKMPEYDRPDAELEIYAAVFASGERRTRMLQAFSARGLLHPLYAVAALQAGLMGQQEAWDYLYGFAEQSVPLELLEDFFALVSDEVTVRSVKERLNAFSGEITADVDADGQIDLRVMYARGRPQAFSWDENHDGILEWSGTCDFGVPEYIHLTQGNVGLFYGTYPAVVKAIISADRGSSEIETTFNLLDETFDWSPVSIEPLECVKTLTGLSFFVPRPVVGQGALSEDRLLASCSSFEVATQERPAAFIRFAVLDGVVQTADYYTEGRRYAHAVFEGGIPAVRSLDTDGDGIFETTESIGFDPENEMLLSEASQRQVMANLFGRPVSGGGLYIRMIQIDQNGDTVPDFSEEYLAGNGKIASWDFDGDGVWDVRYKRYPRIGAEPLVEDAQFFRLPEKRETTITLWNGEPVKIVSGGAALSVTRGEADSFYWVGAEGTEDDEQFLLERFGDSVEQGVSVVVESPSARMLAVRIGGSIFCELLPPSSEGGGAPGSDAAAEESLQRRQ
ncbi:MAG: hypothetical protein K2H09_10230 [Treponemataceae bacterium]|nr:hypothetical protein [Treponemataceae bacterium]